VGGLVGNPYLAIISGLLVTRPELKFCSVSDLIRQS